MFAWKEKQTIREQMLHLTEGDNDLSGANRRAIGLVPNPVSKETREVYQTGKIRYQQLLLSIESKQNTCCLRIANPRLKSRGAILVYKGRVLGCLYGNKAIPEQLFGAEALKCSIQDMSAQDTVVDTYVLTPEVAIAAGALFHSFPMPAADDEDAFALLERGIHGLMRTKSPGTVVISSAEKSTIAMVYLFGGEIVGIYSYQDGWLEPSFQVAQQIIVDTLGAHVMASSLLAHNMDEVLQLTIGLTGLNDIKQSGTWRVLERDDSPNPAYPLSPQSSPEPQTAPETSINVAFAQAQLSQPSFQPTAC